MHGWRTSLVSMALGGSLTLGCASAPERAGATCPPGASQPDDGLARLSDEQLVRKLLDVTGASGLGKQVGDAMMENLRRMPNLPPGMIDRMKQNLHTEDLTERILPIYLKHYNRETAIRFYQSDSGQALVKALPAVTAESMEVGRTWGKELATKALNGLPPPSP